MVLAVRAVPQAASPQSNGSVTSAAATAADYKDVLNRYCVTCHNDTLKTGGLTLDKMDFANIGAGADVWEKVAKKLRSGMMPPQGKPKPDDAMRNNLASWLETNLDRAAATAPNPGRPLLHRLNRAEYANAIRDLLALEVDATTLLPPDDSGYGFDNNADTLGISPVLLERYLSAAGQISSLAIGDPEIGTADRQSESDRMPRRTGTLKGCHWELSAALSQS